MFLTHDDKIAKINELKQIYLSLKIENIETFGDGEFLQLNEKVHIGVTCDNCYQIYYYPNNTPVGAIYYGRDIVTQSQAITITLRYLYEDARKDFYNT